MLQNLGTFLITIISRCRILGHFDNTDDPIECQVHSALDFKMDIKSAEGGEIAPAQFVCSEVVAIEN